MFNCCWYDNLKVSRQGASHWPVQPCKKPVPTGAPRAIIDLLGCVTIAVRSSAAPYYVTSAALFFRHLPPPFFRTSAAPIFTRPLLPEGSSLQVEILFVCLSVCQFVRHHFIISKLGPSNQPRIMLGPTHYASLDRGGHPGCQIQNCQKRISG